MAYKEFLARKAIREIAAIRDQLDLLALEEKKVIEVISVLRAPKGIVAILVYPVLLVQREIKVRRAIREIGEKRANLANKANRVLREYKALKVQ